MQVDRWVVQPDERRHPGGQRLVQQPQRVLGELAAVDPLPLGGIHQRVHGNQPVAGHVDDGFSRPEVLHETRAHVVVAGAYDERTVMVDSSSAATSYSTSSP